MSRFNTAQVQQWAGRLSRFEQVDQTVGAFCQTEGVSVPSFYYWKKKLGLLPGSEQRAEPIDKALSSASRAFQPVELVAATPSSAIVRLPGGIEMELGHDLRVIKAIVEQLTQSTSQREGRSSC